MAEMLMEGESCSFHELDSRGEILRLSSMARGRKLVHELEIGNCLEPIGANLPASLLLERQDDLVSSSKSLPEAVFQ